MKTRFRILGVMVLALAAAVAAIGPGSSRNADAAGANISCEIPLNVVCEVSHPFGIKSVVVKVDFGGDIGVLNVVDNDYFGCPKSVQVSWDPIVPNATFVVETCDPLPGGGLTVAPNAPDYQFGGQTFVANTKSVGGARYLALKPLRR